LQYYYSLFVLIFFPFRLQGPFVQQGSDCNRFQLNPHIGDKKKKKNGSLPLKTCNMSHLTGSNNFFLKKISIYFSTNQMLNDNFFLKSNIQKDKKNSNCEKKRLKPARVNPSSPSDQVVGSG
jgi:hypothetical protein